MICETCEKKLTDDDKYVISPSVSISDWDIEHHYKRKLAYVCCGKFRMTNQEGSQHYSYEISSDVTLTKKT